MQPIPNLEQQTTAQVLTELLSLIATTKFSYHLLHFLPQNHSWECHHRVCGQNPFVKKFYDN